MKQDSSSGQPGDFNVLAGGAKPADRPGSRSHHAPTRNSRHCCLCGWSFQGLSIPQGYGGRLTISPAEHDVGESDVSQAQAVLGAACLLTVHARLH